MPSFKRSKKHDTIEYTVESPKRNSLLLEEEQDKVALNEVEDEEKANQEENCDISHESPLAEIKEESEDHINNEQNGSNEAVKTLLAEDMNCDKAEGGKNKDDVKTEPPLKRTSSIKKMLSIKKDRPVSQLSVKSEGASSAKVKKTSSLRKKLSFSKKKKDKSNLTVMKQETLSGSNTNIDANSMVLNRGMDDWRMNGLMVKSASLHSLPSQPHKQTSKTDEISPAPQGQEEHNICTLNEEEAKQPSIEASLQGSSLKPLEKESEKGSLNSVKLDDALIVTVHHLRNIVQDMHMEMPDTVPCDDWLYLNLQMSPTQSIATC